jgi:hypothetical protein
LKAWPIKLNKEINDGGIDLLQFLFLFFKKKKKYFSRELFGFFDAYSKVKNAV